MKETLKIRSDMMDYFGYASPAQLLRETCNSVAKEGELEGVDFRRLMPAIGATRMMGQVVLEFFAPAMMGMEVEVQTLPHEEFGVASVYRSSISHNGVELMRASTKILTVYFQERKVVPAEALAPFWKIPASPCGEPIEFIQLPKDLELAETYVVRYRDCDANRHMTAFRYVELVCELVGYWGEHMHQIRRMQVDYRSECLPGDTLQLYHGVRDGVHYVTGIHRNGRQSFAASVELEPEETVRLKDQESLQMK